MLEHALVKTLEASNLKKNTIRFNVFLLFYSYRVIYICHSNCIHTAFYSTSRQLNHFFMTKPAVKTHWLMISVSSRQRSQPFWKGVGGGGDDSGVGDDSCVDDDTNGNSWKGESSGEDNDSRGCDGGRNRGAGDCVGYAGVTGYAMLLRVCRQERELGSSHHRSHSPLGGQAYKDDLWLFSTAL